jgi:nitronate monooxygenase
MTVPRDLFADVRLPVMAAPMFIVSSLELAIAGCRAGVDRVILPDDVKPRKDNWSGGHSAGLVDDVPSVAQVVDRLIAEFDAARLQPDWRAQASRRLNHNRIPA